MKITELDELTVIEISITQFLEGLGSSQLLLESFLKNEPEDKVSPEQLEGFKVQLQQTKDLQEAGIRVIEKINLEIQPKNTKPSPPKWGQGQIT